MVTAAPVLPAGYMVARAGLISLSADVMVESEGYSA